MVIELKATKAHNKKIAPIKIYFFSMVIDGVIELV